MAYAGAQVWCGGYLDKIIIQSNLASGAAGLGPPEDGLFKSLSSGSKMYGGIDANWAR